MRQYPRASKGIDISRMAIHKKFKFVRINCHLGAKIAQLECFKSFLVRTKTLAKVFSAICLFYARQHLWLSHLAHFEAQKIGMFYKVLKYWAL
jgi:hypothetical protein